jgi:hypothetical protein
MEYRVTWTIDLEAESPLEAAKLSREIQLDPNSIATHFVVSDEDGNCVEIDLDRE